MDDRRLAEIRERHARATKGPWKAGTMTHTSGNVETWVEIPGAAGFFHDCTDEDGATWTVNGYSTEQGPHDAAFIAHSWQDTLDLLAEVERLRGKLDLIETMGEGGFVYAGSGTDFFDKDEANRAFFDNFHKPTGGSHDTE